MTNICIFASGQGSNFENIVNHFKDSKSINISFLVSNKKDCGAIQKAKNHNIKTLIVSDNYSDLIQLMIENQIKLIVLAGYLKKIPIELIKSFTIINIHPSLLPKFGGKGMYGMNVHKAVIESGELESGITIHYVNEEFDKGEIISQYKCKIEKEDTPEILSHKVHTLEKNFPVEIEMLINKLNLII